MGLLANNTFTTNLNFLGNVQGTLMTAFKINKSFVNNSLMFSGSQFVSVPDGSYEDSFTKPLELGGIASNPQGDGYATVNANAVGNVSGHADGVGSIPYINLAAGRNMTAHADGVGDIIQSNMTAKGWMVAKCQIGASPSAFDIAQAVWLGKPSSYDIPDTMGKALISAGSAGDPWSTTLPGAYTGNQAGAIMQGMKNNTGLIPALL